MHAWTVQPQLLLIRQSAKKSRRSVFLVGGAVRDFLLKKPCRDFDFAIDREAIPFAQNFARAVKGSFVLLDKAHGSARVVKKIDQQIYTFDFTDWRAKTIAKDLQKRDFTVNAMAIDMVHLDHYQDHILEVPHTRTDLKSKRVRMVSSRAFVEDPLRLLRAYTLQSTLGFKIEAKTLAQIKKDVHLISSVAMERVREELFKILASQRAYATCVAMDKIGLLPKMIPQITVMYQVEQGGYHHLDVWKHSLEVLHQLELLIAKGQEDPQLAQYWHADIGGGHSRLALIKMAALLHDIGKPQTKKPEGNRMTFHSHENVGAGITRHVAKHLKLSVKERYFLEDAVRMHLRPGYLSNFKRPSDKAVFRYMRDAQKEAVSLSVLALADQASTCGPLTTKAKHQHHAKICHMLIERYFEEKEQKPKVRLITGNDLIKKLKLKPSPLFGKILSAVEEATALQQVQTKEQALDLAAQLKENMTTYQLDEIVVSVQGNAAAFLNGVSSNDLDKPLNAFLNPHGRIIATVRQKRIHDEEFLLAVPALAVEHLLSHLNRYAPLSHAQLQKTDLKSYIDLNSQEILFTTQGYANSIPDEEFILFRLLHHLPLMGVDYQANEFILNVHEHDYVSYTKGCFVGQEPISKVHNRSKPTKKLVVRYQDECSGAEGASMTSQAKDPANGRIKGFVFIVNHS